LIAFEIYTYKEKQTSYFFADKFVLSYSSPYLS